MDKRKVEDFLINHGIYPNLKGFHYSVSAIMAFTFGVKIMSVYNDIAEIYQVTPTSVERGIRHARAKSPRFGELSNEQFIAYARLLIKREDNDE